MASGYVAGGCNHRLFRSSASRMLPRPCWLGLLLDWPWLGVAVHGWPPALAVRCCFHHGPCALDAAHRAALQDAPMLLRYPYRSVAMPLLLILRRDVLVPSLRTQGLAPSSATRTVAFAIYGAAAPQAVPVGGVRVLSVVATCVSARPRWMHPAKAGHVELWFSLCSPCHG